MDRVQGGQVGFADRGAAKGPQQRSIGRWKGFPSLSELLTPGAADLAVTLLEHRFISINLHLQGHYAGGISPCYNVLCSIAV